MGLDNMFYNASQPLSYLRQGTIDEFLDRFKADMKEYIDSQKCKRIAQVPIYESFTDFGWEYNNEYQVPKSIYEFIPEAIIENLTALLSEANLEDHVGEISSILHTWYCRQLLFQVDQKHIDKNRKFDEQFQALYEILSDDIQDIKLLSLKKTVSIKNSALINLLRQSFVESVLKLPEAIDYIDNLQQSGIYEDKPGEQIKQGAAFNILIYLQTQTEYLHNASKNAVSVVTFKNKQLLLIYKTMVIARIIKDEDLLDSESSNLIRNYIKRAIIKQPRLIRLFDNPRPTRAKQPAPIDENSVMELFAEEQQRNNERVNAIKQNIEKISSMD